MTKLAKISDEDLSHMADLKAIDLDYGYSPTRLEYFVSEIIGGMCAVARPGDYPKLPDQAVKMAQEVMRLVDASEIH